MSTFAFRNPVEVRFGRGRVGDLRDLAKPPALVVTGASGAARTGLAALLGGAPGLGVFSGVEPNPGPATIDRGAQLAAENGATTIVGLGGGSAMDAAKCIAQVIGGGGTLSAYREQAARGAVPPRSVRLVQVPTTAGSGSEVTRWASVWDQEGNKSSVDEEAGFADVALVDPALTDSMPPRLTAATGLDALAHAMEAIWGIHHDPVSDLYATRALELIRGNLLAAIRAPDEVRRDAMALAALLGGLALSHTRSAAAHALSYCLTGRWGIAHGLAVGILCRALLPCNRRYAPDRVGLVLDALGAGSDDEAAAFIDDVFRAAGLEPTLTGLGMDRESLEQLVDVAGASERLANNPGPPDRGQLLEVLTTIL